MLPGPMTSVSPGLRFEAAPRVEYRSVDRGALLVDVSTGAVFRLNRVGADLWVDLVAGHSLDQAIGALCGRYDATPEQIEADARSLCRQLAAAGLIRETGNTERAPDRVP